MEAVNTTRHPTTKVTVVYAMLGWDWDGTSADNWPWESMEDSHGEAIPIIAVSHSATLTYIALPASIKPILTVIL